MNNKGFKYKTNSGKFARNEIKLKRGVIRECGFARTKKNKIKNKKKKTETLGFCNKFDHKNWWILVVVYGSTSLNKQLLRPDSFIRF